MKHIKRVFTLALALTLVLALSLPALASVSEDDFGFSTEPPQNLYVPRGESFMLSVEVNVPEGFGEVEYQWYLRNSNGITSIEGATAATLQLSPDDPDYPNSSNRAKFSMGGSNLIVYSCGVVASNGRMISSDSAYVHVEGSFLEKLYGLTVEPIVYALGQVIASYGIGFILFPLSSIGRFIENFKGLFMF